MRPLLLELEGFTVYREKQTIDFSKLNFFIIQGKTGAGKTSIVDAITFALYGRVPRYGTQKAHKMVLSKGSDRMRVAFEFSVGSKRYRVERFLRTKPEEYIVRAYEGERRLNLGKSEVERWVEEITGLDYRTFTRVILLPQGEFDRFLKPSSPKERREILINLLNLEIFEKARQIASERYRELLGKKEAMAGEIETLEKLDPKELESLRSDKERIEAENKKLNTEIQNLENLLRKAEEGYSIRKELEELEGRLNDLKKREKEINGVRERIERAEKVLPYIPYVEQAEKSEAQLREKRIEKEKIQKEILKKREELKDVNNKLKEVEKKAKEIPKLREELERVAVLLEKVSSARRDLAEAERRKKEAMEKLESARKLEKELKDREERIAKGEKLIEELNRELEELAFDEEEYIREVEISKEREFLIQTKSKLESKRRELTGTLEKLSALKEEVEALKSKVSLKEDEVKRAGVHHHASEIRRVIREGDVCPVCGSVYKGPPEEKGLLTFEELSRELEKLESLLSQKEKNLTALEEKKSILESEVEALEKEIKGKEEILEGDSPTRVKELETKRKKKRENEVKLKKFHERLSQLLKERETISVKIQTLKTEASSLERESAKLYESVRNVLKTAGEKDVIKAEKNLTRKKEDLSGYIRDLEEKEEELKTLEKQKKEALVRLETSLEETDRAIKSLEEARDSALRKLAPIFRELGGIEEIKATSVKEEDLKKLKEIVENHDREKRSLEERIGILRDKLKDLGRTPEVGELQKKLSFLKKKLEENSEKIGQIRERMKVLEEALERKKKLADDIKEVNEKIRIYEILKEDLKSDRLQDFASSLMLGKIVRKAGEYLLSFTGNYEFHLDEKGDLVVVDRSRGTERAVNSLSGGETFLASLSLALGISDVLSARAHLESLFIDEGFGSLDEETRERVSDMLEVIKQKINRMVGIISHIPDLGDRFNQRIRVLKEERGSRLEIFY